MGIKVLWLDDEFDSDALKSTFIRMEKYFTLIKCYTKDEFLEKIETEEWDAIVLDVLDANGRDSGFRTAVMRIMANYKDEPWFVFSGQTDVVKKESDIRSMLNEEDCQREYADIIYVKSEHNDKLIEDIQRAVGNKPEWQARNSVKSKYREVLSVFDLIGDDSRESFFEILMAIENYREIDHKVYYTQLRIVLEWMFRHANQIGLLHDKCINNVTKQVNLTESSRFMAGKNTEHLGVRLKENKGHFPKLIAENVRNLLSVTGGASHTTEPGEKELINLQEYWKSINSPFLLYSLTFNLCDILIWYNKYQEENNNYARSVDKWDELFASNENNQVCGKITGFSKSGIAFLKPIGGNDTYGIYPLTYKTLKDGDQLTIEWEEQEYQGRKQRVATKILEHKPKVEE